MMARRKKIRGAGRKPQGEFSQLTSPFSLRMPEDLRKQLEGAAKKSGRSVSQELLIRLNVSFARERDMERDPAMRALCFLIAEIASQVVGPHKFNEETKTETPIHNWRFEPFFYRAFKLAVGRILDLLEPMGDISPPKIRIEFGPNSGLATQAEADQLAGILKQSFSSPEARADYAIDYILRWLIEAPQWSPEDRENERRRLEGIGMPSFLREFYGMSDAVKDLSINISTAPDAARDLPFISLSRPKS